MKKILIIEDEVETKNLFLKGLKAEGFHATSAENGRVGLQYAQEHVPDLIICGVMVPELNGYRILTTLRKNPTTAIIPFIFVSAKVTRTDLRRGMELGASDYLTKPCTLEELLRAITTQLNKQTVLQQWYTTQPSPDAEPPDTETTILATNDQWTFPTDPPLDQVFRFIEANYNQSITLSDVAQAVGYSPAYLTNLTRRQTGQTVQRWIIERRMTAARLLLLETDQIVEQIAAQVGYHHAVHFFRQFRQFHGTTPNAWRTANRN